jgi:hypothetical protein
MSDETWSTSCMRPPSGVRLVQSLASPRRCEPLASEGNMAHRGNPRLQKSLIFS